jgi:hypothetical protein
MNIGLFQKISAHLQSILVIVSVFLFIKNKSTEGMYLFMALMLIQFLTSIALYFIYKLKFIYSNIYLIYFIATILLVIIFRNNFVFFLSLATSIIFSLIFLFNTIVQAFIKNKGHAK